MTTTEQLETDREIRRKAALYEVEVRIKELERKHYDLMNEYQHARKQREELINMAVSNG